MVATKSIPIIQFKGLVPALDPRQVKEPNVVNGRNFLLDAEGVYSAFGTDLFTFEKLANPKNSVTFRVQDDIFIFTQSAVLAYDTSAGYLYPVFVFSGTFDVFPWSHAIVGGQHYFARKGPGLLHYNPNDNSWETLSGGSYPTGIVGICAVEDRLIVLGTDKVAYSAISNGLDIVPNVDTGAGAQDLALIGGGNPYGVFEVVDGFITVTDRGLMKSRSVDTPNPFNHRKMDHESHVPINPFCVTTLGEDVVVMLTKVGLVITSGEHPTDWQPLMSEYFKRKVLPQRTLTSPSVIAFYYHHDLQLFFISIADDNAPQEYTHAFVLYVPRDEWGRFDKLHTGFGEVNITEGSDVGFNFGYFGTDGSINVFNFLNRSQAFPDLSEYEGHRHLNFEIPGRYEESVLVGATNMHITPWDREQYTELYRVVPNFQSEFQTIDSYIDIGLLRFTDNEDSVRVSEINDISIGMSAAVDVTNIDLMLETGTVDYLALTGVIDLGFNFIADLEFVVKIVPTKDGLTPIEDQELTCTLITEEGRVRFYDTGGCVGIYHIIRIEALNVNESFHLKFLETEAILAGNL